MKVPTAMFATAAILLSINPAHAALTGNVTVIDAGAVIENVWTADTDTDFLSVVIFVELSTGTLYNNDVIVPGLHTFPQSPHDTYVRIDGNASISTVHGPGCLTLSCGPAPAVFGPTILSVVYSSPGADTGNIGPDIELGSYSFTSDAMGVWSMLLTNAGGDRETTSGVVINGVMVPEPGALGLIVLGGAAILRRMT